jgi:hypothetical protein
MKTLLLLFPFLLLAPQDKGKTKLAWNLPKNRVWEFKKLDKAGRPVKDAGWWIFASELRNDGSNRLLTDTYAGIPYALAFNLPKEDRKPGEAWEQTTFFFCEANSSSTSWNFGMGGGGGIKPVCAKGRWIFRKLDKKSDGDIAHLEALFDLFEVRRDNANNERRLTVTKNNFGTIRVDVLFNVGLGRIAKAAWAGGVRAQERVPDRDRDTKVVEQKLDTAGGIEFAEEVELTRERMEKAAGEQVKKAAEWLRKQQRPAGDFGAGPATESTRLDVTLTGLAVRALLAAGAKPDDAAVDKGLKSLRLQAGTTTMSLAEAVFVLSLAEKPDVPVIKNLLGALLNRRDSKLAAWPGDDDRTSSPNSISTGHAVKALWAAARAGQDPPADVWRNVVETMAYGMADDAGSDVELKLAFEDGFGLPIADGPKSAKPVTWRYDLRADANEPRAIVGGWGFTVIAALETLKLAQLDLERRKQLTDAQKKSIDGAMRQGLAWIQSRGSWRGVAPAESSYSIRRIEFAAAQARVLSMYGVKEIDAVDWWMEVAYHLMRLQTPAGSWDEGGGGPVLETAHAILALAKPWSGR